MRLKTGKHPKNMLVAARCYKKGEIPTLPLSETKTKYQLAGTNTDF